MTTALDLMHESLGRQWDGRYVDELTDHELVDAILSVYRAAPRLAAREPIDAVYEYRRRGSGLHEMAADYFGGYHHLWSEVVRRDRDAIDSGISVGADEIEREIEEGESDHAGHEKNHRRHRSK